MWQLKTAVEHLTMLPNRITCQQKWLRGHLSQEGGEGGNHYKLADKGRVCLFAYLCVGGGGRSRYFTFQPILEAVFEIAHSEGKKVKYTLKSRALSSQSLSWFL